MRFFSFNTEIYETSISKYCFPNEFQNKSLYLKDNEPKIPFIKCVFSAH